MNMIETLTALLITASLTALTLNANASTTDSVKNLTEKTSLEQDTIKAFDNLTANLVSDSQVVGVYETEENIINIEETICENGQDGYVIVAYSKDSENKTAATLNTCSSLNMDLKPEIFEIES